MEEHSVHIVVQGHVQGVGFRWFVLRQAQRLALTGFVRNCWNGDVEIEAAGPPAAVEQLVAEVRRGPSRSHVTRVIVEPTSSIAPYDHFDIL